MERKTHTGTYFHHQRHVHFCSFHHRIVDEPRTPTSPHYGRDTPLVFCIPSTCRYHRLCTLALQMDTFVFHHHGNRIHLHQLVPSRDSLQDFNARIAESVVCSTCHRVYVLLCNTWVCHSRCDMATFTFKTKGKTLPYPTQYQRKRKHGRNT